MSKWELFASLASDGCRETSVVGQRTVRGIVQSVERESGDGRCFNVAVLVGATVERVFVKTVD